MSLRMSARLLSRDCFGREVIDRADGGAVAGDAEFLVGDGPRQAEIGHLHDQLAVVATQQEVGRLDVAVDDALAVGVVEGLHRLDQDGARLRWFEPALVDDVVGEVRPIDEFHRQVVGIADLVPLVEGDDVRVVEPGGVAGLAAEAFQGGGMASRRAARTLRATTRPRLTSTAL